MNAGAPAPRRRSLYDAIIVGAGAAGLFCALTAGQRGRKVLLLEHNHEPGAKILISGGGRCNFTNRETRPERFLSANPHFARSALARFTPADFIALVEKHRIPFYEKTLGQLFCEGAGSARRIVRMLLDECAAGAVELRCGASVSGIRHHGAFEVATSDGAFTAPQLVIATGGLSIPKLGATDFAARAATQFGAPIIAQRPGLVPLTFSDEALSWMRPLSGVAAPVIARCDGASFREAALFTHRGLSGPAILQASSYWRGGGAISLDWLPEAADDALIAAKRARPKAQVATALGALLPTRLAQHFAQGLPMTMLGDLKDQALIDIVRDLKNRQLTPSGTEGYAKAEVTVGGVDTNALDQGSMRVRAAPGLFFIGEAVDVTGWLGGYNFQWAWASGAACGRAL